MPHGRLACRGLCISCSRARPQNRHAPHDRRMTAAAIIAAYLAAAIPAAMLCGYILQRWAR
jgi:hypothetical protein